MRQDKKRSRWTGAMIVLLTLAIAYPLSEGPVRYLDYRTSNRGWFTVSVRKMYDPFYDQFGRPYLGQGFWNYILWWHVLAMKHEGDLDPEPTLR